VEQQGHVRLPRVSPTQKYIVAVAETSNFTRAAERLFLAQPSLSKQIRALEDEIQFPLFERGRNGVKITPAGEMILAYARETLKSRDELISMARAVHLRRVAPLKLGFCCFVNAALLQFFRTRYNSMFPGCEIQLIGGDPTQILQKIREQHIGCAFLHMPIDPNLFHVQ
jgi:DNA-binding transcriptional LysR family regulator